MAKKKKTIKKIYGAFVLLLGLGYLLYQNGYFKNTSFALEDNRQKTISEEIIDDPTLKIYYLDVGQADSILIQENGENVLIDAGNNEDGKKLVSYFKSLGITKFKYVIGTHPHEDHIGGLDNIINNFKVEHFFMPDVMTTSKTFEDVLDALEKNKLKFAVPTIGQKFTLNEASFVVLYLGTDQSDLNNTSIVLKMTYKDTSYLFMGDATEKTEKQLLYKNLNSDVLKVGHHGSEYSSSDDFLNKVNPVYAIISAGKDNSYGHPKQITLDKLDIRNIKTYRTDISGTILLKSDGTNINIETIKTDTNGE